MEDRPIPMNGENMEFENRKEICILCHKREKDFSASSASVLCYECRLRQIKLNIPPKIKLFLAAVCTIFLLSLILLVPVLSSYQNYLDAEKHMKAKEFSFAYDKYSVILGKYNFGVPLILKTADAAVSAQYFGELAELLDTYLVGKKLNDSEYAKAMKYSDFLSAYAETYEAIDNIFTEANDAAVTQEDAEDAAHIALPLIYQKLEALLLEESLDKTLIYFYLGNLSQDSKTAIEYLKLSVEQNAICTYVYSFYGSALRRGGEFDQARQVYQTALALNACDALSWRGLGILQLLEGQNSLGLEFIQHAYIIEPNGLYVPEALVIALCENGLRDDAMAFLGQLIADGFQVEEDFQEYIDGNISLKQYYLD